MTARLAACRNTGWLHRNVVRRPAVFGVLLLVAPVGCGRNSSKSASAPQSNSSASAGGNSQPAPRSIDIKKPVLRLETSLGPIIIQLDGVQAPGTVRNFLNYANEGYYDNTLVHFVDPGKMIVAGGYSADRKPKPVGTPIRNEAHNGLKNVRGTIAMTRDRSLIDSATSQFLINLADAPQRDHVGDGAEQYGYCVFGEITEGLNVADKISQAPTKDQGGDLAQSPDPAIVIKSARVVR